MRVAFWSDGGFQLHTGVYKHHQDQGNMVLSSAVISGEISPIWRKKLKCLWNRRCKTGFPGVCSPIWRLKNISQSGLFARAWQQKNVLSGGAFATLATEKGWFWSGLAS
jgi:hypothetical protein